jgi:hypothetical protein
MDAIRFQQGLYAQEIFMPVKAHKKEISMKQNLEYSNRYRLACSVCFYAVHMNAT